MRGLHVLGLFADLSEVKRIRGFDGEVIDDPRAIEFLRARYSVNAPTPKPITNAIPEGYA